MECMDRQTEECGKCPWALTGTDEQAELNVVVGALFRKNVLVSNPHALLGKSCLGRNIDMLMPYCMVHVRLRRIVISMDLLITEREWVEHCLDRSNYKVIIALSLLPPPLSGCLCNNPRRE